jgi:hypothetical protein
MTMCLLQIALAPDPWTISTAIGTVAAALFAAVAAVVALFFNRRTLKEMQKQLELSIRPYLSFDHDSFRRRALKKWQDLEGEGVPEPQRRQQVIEYLQQHYSVQVSNIGNGPAIDCYFYAYCWFEQNGSVSIRYFRTDWFTVGRSTGPEDNLKVKAFMWKQRSEHWELPPEAERKLGQPWARAVAASEGDWTWDKLRDYLQENSGEFFTYFNQFGQFFMQIRGEPMVIPLEPKHTTPEPRQ